ncbi:MAG: ROK family protein [Cyclobacteriaceae bacterium]|nr:ROK family protein [Cyclobacteriaceae bacterium]UYN85125.1 MAG: ROK family protein [Cyclobacteriaceae bacterium]
MSVNTNQLWGIDLGGTKVEGIIMNSSASAESVFRDRVPTEAHVGYEHVLHQIKKLVDMMVVKAGYKPDKIGIGTPGTMDTHTGLFKNSNSTVLNFKPLKQDLEKLLGMQVLTANDANCFALAETRLGVVKERFPTAEVVFGVIMGTGCGGGIVVNNKVINGLQGIAGEWGHNFLDESGGKCYCGKTGCVENVIAGPALERFYREQSGNSLKLKEIFSRAQDKADGAAVKTINRLHEMFGKALSVVINILDPDVIVVGGGVGNIPSIYSDGISYLKQNVFNDRLDTPVVKPLLGDSAGVFGAAFLTEN